MDITDVRIRLLKDTSDRLKAFCTVTFDDEFVVRDIKIVDGTSGLFIAMPSKKVTFSCPSCRHRNQLRAKFCEECGQRLEEPSMGDGEGRDKLHRDMAHPITTEFRAKLQDRIIEAFNEEFANAGDPDHQKPEDNSAEAESGPPKSEYNDMIAGLKSGGGNDRGGNNRDDGDKGNSRRGDGRGSRSEKPRGRRDDRDKPRREDKPAATKSEAPKPREEKPAAPKRRAPKPAVNEDVDSGGFGAGLEEASEVEVIKPREEKPAAPKRRKPKPVVEEAAVVKEEVESGGFGDGLDVATEVETKVASVDPSDDSTAFGSGIL